MPGMGVPMELIAEGLRLGDLGGASFWVLWSRMMVLAMRQHSLEHWLMDSCGEGEKG